MQSRLYEEFGQPRLQLLIGRPCHVVAERHFDASTAASLEIAATGAVGLSERLTAL
jgi:hypothetical protein